MKYLLLLILCFCQCNLSAFQKTERDLLFDNVFKYYQADSIVLITMKRENDPIEYSFLEGRCSAFFQLLNDLDID